MTIEKGSAWGIAGTVPSDAVRATTDAEVAAGRGSRVQPLGGNLWRSLGSPRQKETGDACMVLPIDLIRCTIEVHGAALTVHAVSEVRVSGWFSRSGLTVVTNVGQLGSMNLAPRAHPNDGELDVFVLEGSMGFRQRVLARRRARTGTHMPHPAMHVTRSRHLEVARTDGSVLMVDGVRFGSWTRVVLDVEPDSMTVLV